MPLVGGRWLRAPGRLGRCQQKAKIRILHIYIHIYTYIHTYLNVCIGKYRHCQLYTSHLCMKAMSSHIIPNGAPLGAAQSEELVGSRDLVKLALLEIGMKDVKHKKRKRAQRKKWKREGGRDICICVQVAWVCVLFSVNGNAPNCPVGFLPAASLLITSSPRG